MTRRAALAVLVLAAAHARADGPSGAPVRQAARYRVSGDSPWRVVRAVESPGYRLALSSPDGRDVEIRVLVDASPLRDDAAIPLDARALPPEARAALALPEAPDPEMDALAVVLTRSARTVLEAVERVVAFTSRRIRYEAPGGAPETAIATLRNGRGSCVGRSLLADELLRRAGIPARQVTGVLAAGSVDELTPESRPFFGDWLGGIRHRWIEAYVPGLGWVPSDPGGLANGVTARHVALAATPDPAFGLERLELTPETRRLELAFPGPGRTLARPRIAPLEAGEVPR